MQILEIMEQTYDLGVFLYIKFKNISHNLGTKFQTNPRK